MSTFANSSAIPMFNGENYRIGLSRMKFVLRSQSYRLLTLKREFELMKFIYQKVVEKIMALPERFEVKISAIEESCNLQTLTIT
uniref:Uncharacterized protein n=1 Tax=Cajanus cajan TaxID=3821 RepID=A0A151SVT0_CAJCA|nr:hypothetical protein KK1_014283 [Cajanus cajan]